MKDKELQFFIGSKIKDFRQKNSWTQTDLADKLNVAKSTIAGYEKGYRNPSQTVLFSLADIFNVSINDFFPNTETQTTDTVKAITDRLEASNKEKAISYLTALLEEQEKEQNQMEAPHSLQNTRFRES